MRLCVWGYNLDVFKMIVLLYVNVVDMVLIFRIIGVF